MKKIRFIKMSGAGNDFILLGDEEARASRLSGPELARRLCDRRRSVGADGILIVSRGSGKKSAPSMDYYNLDGSTAFCANGSRCAAWWMHQAGWVGNQFSFSTIEGFLRAVITGKERAKIRMPDARNLRLNLKVRAARKTWTVNAVNTGVPHLVIEVKDLEDFDVFANGRELRHKAGANVNFIRLHRRGLSGVHGPVVRIRTYERGVEDETLACGTGATASAIYMHTVRGLKAPVHVITQGGDLLTVSFHRKGNHFTDIWLEGPVKITFQGETTL